MLDIARDRVRVDVAPGDSLAEVEEKVSRAGPSLDDERQAALWLYGWHHAEHGLTSPVAIGGAGG
jgi:hypothetical protein